MIYLAVLISPVPGLITQSRVSENSSEDIFAEKSVEHFCGVEDKGLFESYWHERSDWSIDDFDDSVGWREGDGLQLRRKNGGTVDTQVRFWRPENSGFGKFGTKSNGTVIGISFPTEETVSNDRWSSYPDNYDLPLSSRRKRQIQGQKSVAGMI